MNPVTKNLITVGLLIVAVGALWPWIGGAVSKLGRLPGDIRIERENVRFYFPLASSLLVSALISILLYLIRRFSGR